MRGGVTVSLAVPLSSDLMFFDAVRPADTQDAALSALP
jgi:hypothetical protein